MLPDVLFLQQLYNGSVAEKLQTARQLLHNYRERLAADTNLADALEQMRLLAGQLQDHMTRMRMGQQCVQCSAREGGGCCSLYMAGETDAVQLLLNMLSGLQVEPVRDDGVECCYLGQHGCIFLFKPMFCLNYNCAHIRQNSTSGDYRELERLTGKLLQRQYDAEKIILDYLGQQIKR